ncbi:MAG: efflux RND transporter periplasmic adaptor subunit [Candidatus Eremiobacteraeota bacterium]|nr:efflux RND transporter periplasmic adaptor subunit [Candidatus Eremiobacteraeota bacterium]
MKAVRGIFFCLIVLSMLAVMVRSALAAPMVMHVGSAEVMLSLSPDPPRPGLEHATIDVTGVNNNALRQTTVTYTTRMPTMNMTGATGTARAVAGHAGEWTFDLPMAMATQWAVTLNLSGSITGSTTFAFGVAGSSGASEAIPGMGSNGSGSDRSWHIAAFALAILFIIAAVATWNLARSRTPSERAKSRLSPSTAVTGAVAVLVILGVSLLQSKLAPPTMDMRAMSNVQGAAPIPVTLGTVRRSGLGIAITAPGIVAAFLTQDVSARTPGVISAVKVYNGDRVSAGQVVATLSEPDLSAQAASASAAARSDYSAATAATIEAHHHAPNEVSIAEADARSKAEQARYWRGELSRERMLLNNGAVSPQEFQSERAQAAAAFAAADAAEHQVANSRANIEMTQAQANAALQKASSSSSLASAQSILAGYTTLVAPDDGVVVSRLVDPGSYVGVGTPILRIAVIGKVRIQASVAQEDLTGIGLGTPFDAVIDGIPTIHAVVTAVQPVADPTAHTAMIEAIVSNQGGLLRQGTYARVTLRPSLGPTHAGATVPSSAVLGSGRDAVVWINVNGTAHRVAVTVLTDDGSSARVRGAVKPGDRVVLEGAQDLQEGVMIAESRP